MEYRPHGQKGNEVMTVEGIVSKHQRPGNQGSYYQLTTDGGTELAISMTASMNQNDDARVLEPFLGKRVAADGLIRKQTGQLVAFAVKLA